MKSAKKIIFLMAIYLSSAHAATEQSPSSNEQKATQTIDSRYTRLNSKGKATRHKTKQVHCIKDNETGLVWELKTDDGGVHDKDNSYRWGGRGAEALGTSFFDDWNILLDATNEEKLCGFSDWRVPSINELKSLIISTEKTPVINSDYFVLTLASPYWSASAYANYPEHGQTVHFETGASYYYNGFRGNLLPLRLVRGKPY